MLYVIIIIYYIILYRHRIYIYCDMMSLLVITCLRAVFRSYVLHTALFPGGTAQQYYNNIICTAADNDRRPDKRSSSKYGGVPTITRVPLYLCYIITSTSYNIIVECKKTRARTFSRRCRKNRRRVYCCPKRYSCCCCYYYYYYSTITYYNISAA